VLGPDQSQDSILNGAHHVPERHEPSAIRGGPVAICRERVCRGPGYQDR
jgi:hypothetical protein